MLNLGGICEYLYILVVVLVGHYLIWHLFSWDGKVSNIFDEGTRVEVYVLRLSKCFEKQIGGCCGGFHRRVCTNVAYSMLEGGYNL